MLLLETTQSIGMSAVTSHVNVI